jgi:serine/threonine/tyrosine protein kinase RAD53
MPIVITCTGRNGVYINDEKLGLGDKRILLENDEIKLSPRTLFFRINYKSSPSDVPECEELKNYYIGDSIGSGANGTVNITFEKKPNERFLFGTYAMKKISKHRASRVDDNLDEMLMREVDIMKRMNSPYIIELVESFNTPTHLIIMLPMMFGGDLLHRILNSERGRLSERDAKFFILQVLLGLKYMHKKGIAHRDIKCENLLLCDNGPSPLLKISDFGLSKVLNDCNTVCGTPVIIFDVKF